MARAEDKVTKKGNLAVRDVSKALTASCPKRETRLHESDVGGATRSMMGQEPGGCLYRLCRLHGLSMFKEPINLVTASLPSIASISMSTKLTRTQASTTPPLSSD